MATNWSNSSGFGGGLGGSRLSSPRAQSSGTGSGLGGDIGQGLGSGSSYQDVLNRVRGSIFGSSAPSPQYKSMTPAEALSPERDPNPTAPMYKNFAGDTRPPPTTFGSNAGAATGQQMVTQSYADLLASQYGPQLAAAAAYPDYLTGHAGLQDQMRGLQRAGLIANSSFDRQSLDLKSRGIGLDRNSNALKMAGFGLDRQDNSNERGYITRLRELAGLDNTNSANRISFEGQDKARDIKSGYLTGGTSFAPGHTYDQGANYLRTLNDLNTQEYGYQRDLAGFDRKEQGLDTSDARIGLSEQELGIANQRLDLMAGQLGIDRSRLEDSLSRGLAELGLQGQISAAELAYQITNSSGEYGQLLSKLFSDALALGVPPGDWLNFGTGNQTTYPADSNMNSSMKVM